LDKEESSKNQREPGFYDPITYDIKQKMRELAIQKHNLGGNGENAQRLKAKRHHNGVLPSRCLNFRDEAKGAKNRTTMSYRESGEEKAWPEAVKRERSSAKTTPSYD